MYGAGPYRMSQELGIPMTDSRKLIDHYFDTYPGIRRYMDETIEKLPGDSHKGTTKLGHVLSEENLNCYNTNFHTFQHIITNIYNLQQVTNYINF